MAEHITTETGRDWALVCEQANAAIKADYIAYGERHGLRGLVVKEVSGLVVVYHEGANPVVAIAAMLAALALKATGDSNDTGLDDIAQDKIEELVRQITFPGFVVPASANLGYTISDFNGEKSIRFTHPNLREFGPKAERPKVEHQLGWALKLVKTCDRNKLVGAYS